MLFVFSVESGIMHTYEMSLALENVSKLQEAIQAQLGLPVNRQVLLISGGQPLDSNTRMCTYPAGTDTNPIFLFVKRDSTSEYDVQPHRFPDDDMGAVVLDHLNMPPNYATVAKRAQLAHRLDQMAKETLRLCEQCVHEQHLQQQGWAAVLANLDDTVDSFKKIALEAERVIEEYLSKRGSYLELINHFYDDLNALKKIPVLAVLMKLKRSESYKEELYNAALDLTSDGEVFTESSDEQKEHTLLDWLTIENKNSSLDDIYKFCNNGVQGCDHDFLLTLKQDVDSALRCVDEKAAINFHALGDRLSSLERAIRDIKKTVQEQTDLAQSFQLNSSRASSIKDASILPDLCESHYKQLKVMYENHQKVITFRQRIFRCKYELCGSLVKRLDWITRTENRIALVNSRVVLNKVKLSHINEHFGFLEQIHRTPAMYLSAVVEVFRRKIFSQSFLVWASDLACQMLTIHNDEVARRKDFYSSFEDHFIANLFPGMEDLPPPFATQPPRIYDSNLPDITQDDIGLLLERLPEFKEQLNIPDMSSITKFFAARSVMRMSDKVDDAKEVVDKLVDIGLETNLDDNSMLKAGDAETGTVTAHGLPHLKDLDKGCESETDTEEFEKVGQSPLDLHFDKEIPSPRPGKQDASTLTEDNLQISHEEHEKLQAIMTRLVALTQQALLDLRQELNYLKTYFLEQSSMLLEHQSQVSTDIEQRIMKDGNEYKDKFTKFLTQQEGQLDEYKAYVDRLMTEAKLLSEEKTQFEEKLSHYVKENKELMGEIVLSKEKSKEELENLRSLIETLEIEKERSVKEATDRLTRDHKTEIENIRSRFRLMTMERSPSDSSLERVERPDLGTNHETIMMQMQEKHELDKHKAVNEAVSQANEKWKRVLEEKLNELSNKLERDRDALVQDIAKKISEEKDKQIDILREREKNLTLECGKYKYTIQQLAESETNSNSMELLGKVEILEKEKGLLEVEIEKLKKEKSDMAASVAIYEGKVDASTSPLKHKKDKESSKSVVPSMTKPALLNVESCRRGDQVFIFWDKDHESFRILQNDRYLYFLHSDCLEGLGLQITDKQPNKSHEMGEVADKEYCHARKSQNRYRVPKGTKFFRIKVKPIAQSLSREVTRSYHQASSHGTLQQAHLWQSQSTAPTALEFSTTDSGPCQSLPTSPTKTKLTVTEEKPEEASAHMTDRFVVESATNTEVVTKQPTGDEIRRRLEYCARELDKVSEVVSEENDASKEQQSETFRLEVTTDMDSSVVCDAKESEQSDDKTDERPETLLIDFDDEDKTKLLSSIEESGEAIERQPVSDRLQENLLIDFNEGEQAQMLGSDSTLRTMTESNERWGSDTSREEHPSESVFLSSVDVVDMEASYPEPPAPLSRRNSERFSKVTKKILELLNLD